MNRLTRTHTNTHTHTHTQNNCEMWIVSRPTLESTINRKILYSFSWWTHTHTHTHLSRSSPRTHLAHTLSHTHARTPNTHTHTHPIVSEPLSLYSWDGLWGGEGGWGGVGGGISDPVECWRGGDCVPNPFSPSWGNRADRWSAEHNLMTNGAYIQGGFTICYNLLQSKCQKVVCKIGCKSIFLKIPTRPTILMCAQSCIVAFSPGRSRGRFLRRFRSDLAGSLLYLKNELGPA